MEEHAERRAVGRRRGLLTLLLLLFAGAGAFPASHAAYLRSLSFKCQEGYIFSSSNTVFSVDIAYLPPEEVSVYLNSIPNNVELVSIKKVTYIPPSTAGQGYGTHVEITVRFSTPGTVKLFAADLETKEGFFKIPFPTVRVWANMQILKPELDVSVAGGWKQGEVINATVGSHIAYTVRVKYASSVRSISYEIPENSVFIEKERLLDFGDTPAQAADFSPDFRPAARYDWQPLAAGEFELPPVSLVVLSYSGNLVSLPFPSIKVHVGEKGEAGAEAGEKGASPRTETGAKPGLPPAFGDAFAEIREDRAAAKPEGSLADAELLAVLYGEELSSFPFFDAAMEERMALEQKLGKNGLPPLRRRPVLMLLVFFTFASVVSVFILILLKFFARAAFIFVIAVLMAVSALVYGSGLSRQLAVSKGGTLYPIPESGLSQGGDLPPASVVTVLKQAGDWYYVSFNDTNGWIPSDSVILVH